MAQNTSFSMSEFFMRHRFVILLGTILFMIIGGPFLRAIFQYKIITDVLLTVIFAAAIFAISQKRINIFISMGLALPMFASTWSYYFFKSSQLLAAGQVFGVLFVGFTINCLIKFIFSQKTVTREVIYAAMIVYLLMAITWSFAYSMLEYFFPGSFSSPQGAEQDFFHFLYFSYVTITTLGYGDVLPLTQKAKSLVMLEAVTGQMYLVVAVAWLVGMHVSRRSR
jgi:hypothetical protein